MAWTRPIRLGLGCLRHVELSSIQNRCLWNLTSLHPSSSSLDLSHHCGKSHLKLRPDIAGASSVQSFYYTTKVIKPISVHSSIRKKNVRGSKLASIDSKKKYHKNNIDRSRSSLGIENLSLTSSMHEIDELDEKADTIEANLGRLGSLQTAIEAEKEQIQNLIKINRMVRFKTIEKKYFRRPRSLNILTWAAKEQMRYLHYHEEWSVEELADNFPVSLESVIKILKSRIRLHRNDDIRRHDRDVRNNWLKVKKALEEKEDLDGIEFKDLLSLEKQVLVNNAIGLNNLPLPQPIGPPRAKGAFSLIVKDCLEEKRKEHQANLEAEEMVKNQFLVVLEEIKKLVDQKLTVLKNRKCSPQKKERLELTEDEDHNHVSYRSAQKIKRTIAMKNNSSANNRNMNRLVTYQNGDCVYDSYGNFLYRIF